MTEPRVHEVIQAAMGWYDSHLHRFRTGNDYRSLIFVTAFDLEEGAGGMPEGGVRLDQLLAEKGDRLWYEYDFGDSWDHRLVVEEVLGGPPPTPRCTGGRMACPPEDCGQRRPGGRGRRATRGHRRAAELTEEIEHRGSRLLRDVLGRPNSHRPTEVTEAEDARLTETYLIFLDVTGDGVILTGAVRSSSSSPTAAAPLADGSRRRTGT